jgi:hypothetical protein
VKARKLTEAQARALRLIESGRTYLAVGRRAGADADRATLDALAARGLIQHPSLGDVRITDAGRAALESEAFASAQRALDDSAKAGEAVERAQLTVGQQHPTFAPIVAEHARRVDTLRTALGCLTDEQRERLTRMAGVRS